MRKVGRSKDQHSIMAHKQAALAEVDEFVERVRQRRKGAHVSNSADDLAAIREERMEALDG